MIKIEGYINKLEVENSKILPIENLGKQAVNTALIGTLVGSASLMSNAPIMALAAQGRAGKTFRGKINGIRVVGQFTSLKFNENMPLIFIISEEEIDGHHLVYAALEPNNGILHMIYEMGRSVKNGYRDLLINSLIFSLVLSLILTILFIYIAIEGDNGFVENLKEYYLYYLGGVVFCSLLIVIVNFVFFRKMIEFSGRYSEEIFRVLGFENVKEQDFYNDCRHEDGRSFSVMNYRKKLIGKDPYPVDYFDKKNDQT